MTASLWHKMWHVNIEKCVQRNPGDMELANLLHSEPYLSVMHANSHSWHCQVIFTSILVNQCSYRIKLDLHSGLTIIKCLNNVYNNQFLISGNNQVYPLKVGTFYLFRFSLVADIRLVLGSQVAKNQNSVTQNFHAQPGRHVSWGVHVRSYGLLLEGNLKTAANKEKTNLNCQEPLVIVLVTLIISQIHIENSFR